MEFLNFLREEPVMTWFVLLAILLIIVLVVSALWRSVSGRNSIDAAKQPAQVTKSTRFGNQTELVILFVGLLLLLAVIGWIRGTFFR